MTTPTRNRKGSEPYGLDGPIWAEFFSALRLDGVATTAHDHQRLSVVLRASGLWTREELRGVMVALLARRREDTRVIAQCFDTFFPIWERISPSEAEIRVGASTRPLGPRTGVGREGRRPVASRNGSRWPGWRKGWRMPRRDEVARVLLGIFFLSLLLVVSPKVGQIPDEVPLLPPPEVVLDGLVIEVEHEVNRPKRAEWLMVWSAVVGCLLASLALVSLWRRTPTGARRVPPWRLARPRRKARFQRWLEDVPWRIQSHIRRFAGVRTSGDRPASTVPQDDRPPAMVGGRAQHALARHGLNRVVHAFRRSRGGRGRSLDLDATVDRTCRTAGLPVLIFRRRMVGPAIALLADRDSPLLRFSGVVPAVRSALAKAGAEVESASVSLAGWRDPPLPRHVAWARRRPTLVFGEAARLSTETRRTLGRSLARRQWVWVEVRESRLWGRAVSDLEALGVPVFEATGAGIAAALTEGVRRGRPARRRMAPFSPAPFSEAHPASRVPRARVPVLATARAVDRYLDDAMAWAAACAMVPPPLGMGMAHALRRRFFSNVSPEQLQRLALLPESVAERGGRLTFAPRTRALLRYWFQVRIDDPRQRDILRFILACFDAVEPPVRSVANHRLWQWQRARVQLDLEPGEALATVARLSRTTLRPAIRAVLADLEPPPGVESNDPDPPYPDRSTLRVAPRNAKSPRGLLGGWRLRRLSPLRRSIGRTRWPRDREWVAALAILVIAGRTSWGLGGFVRPEMETVVETRLRSLPPVVAPPPPDVTPPPQDATPPPQDATPPPQDATPPPPVVTPPPPDVTPPPPVVTPPPPVVTPPPPVVTPPPPPVTPPLAPVQRVDLRQVNRIDLDRRPTLLAVGRSSSGEALGVVALGDDTIRGYQLPLGVELFSGLDHGASILALALAPDGRSLVSAGRGGDLFLWDLNADGDSSRKGVNLSRQGWDIFSAAFNPARLATGEVELATGDTMGRVRIWHFTPGVAPSSAAQELPFPGGTVIALGYTPSGHRLVAADDDGRLRVWDRAGGAWPVRANTTVNSPRALAVGPSLVAVTGGRRARRLTLLDLDTATQQARWSLASDGEALAWSPRYDVIVAGGKKALSFWRPDREQGLVSGQTGVHDGIRDLAYMPGGGYLVTAEGKSLLIWAVAETREDDP